MTRIEHAPAGDAGTVSMAAVRVAGRLMLEVVVHPPVLRALPWYRGRCGVSAELTAAGTRLDIVRGSLSSPFRLLARPAGQPLAKLPPVQLRIPALAGMADAEQPAEPVRYLVGSAALILTLPSWARRAPAPKVLDLAGGCAVTGLEQRLTGQQVAVVEAVVGYLLDNPDAHAMIGLIDLGPNSARGVTLGGTSDNPLMVVMVAAGLLDRAVRMMRESDAAWLDRFRPAVAEASAVLGRLDMFNAVPGSALQ